MGQVGYFEIFVDDLERAQAFYSAVFGWSFREVPFPYPYVMIDLPARDLPGLGLGGMTLRKDGLGHGRASASVLHVMVEDLAAALDRVRVAGGSVTGEVMRIPAGPFAYATDSEGNTLGVWQPAAP